MQERQKFRVLFGEAALSKKLKYGRDLAGLHVPHAVQYLGYIRVADAHGPGQPGLLAALPREARQYPVTIYHPSFLAGFGVTFYFECRRQFA